jgi:ribosomal protein S6--L-glutamate ligase
LEALKIKASDPINVSFKMAEEKISQMPRLARAGIQIPETIIAREESYKANKEYILQNVTFPCVFKTDGKKGDAVFKVASVSELEERIAQKNAHELFLIQEFIPNTFDTRTLIAYNKVLGTIKRTAQAGNFHNNVSKGASVEAYALTEEETDVALRSTKACKLDFGGVDIIHTQSGPVVLEVNKSPQIKGFESIYGKRSVFKEIAKTIETELL